MKFDPTGGRRPMRGWSVGAVALAAALGVSACAPSSAPPAAPGEAEQQELGISDADYSLDALIEAAKDEGPITVVDSTGKIVDIAENFSAKYGIEAVGVKMKVGEQREVILREGQANNVKSDVILMADTQTAVGELLPSGDVVSWFPPDMTDVVPNEFQKPAIVTQEFNVWAYNTEVYGDTCPVDNMWALTTAEWTGKLGFQDPLLKTDYPYWFNQMETHGDDLVREAYENQFGEALETDEASATAEWVKRLAANKPVVTNSDDDAAAAAGAPGQEEPFMAFISSAKFRDNVDSGYKLGLCEGMEPWSGRAYTKTAMIATGTKSPNAAKLFVHYVFTEEGIAPQVADGKMSTNTEIVVPADEPSGVGDAFDEILIFDTNTAVDDFDRVQEWQDFWRANLQ